MFAQQLSFRCFSAVFVALVLCFSHPAFAQMSPELKEFLSSKSFPELIRTFEKDRVTIHTIGKRAETIAARNYTIGKGYRCQAFAGSQRENAEKVAADLRALNLGEVYLFETPEGLYKVQMGDFSSRVEAEYMMQKLRYANIPGVWIVESDIHEPKVAGGGSAPAPIANNSVITAPEPEPEPIELQPKPEINIHYSIQVFATRSHEKALELQKKFETETNQPTRIVKQQSIWKVMVGQFKSREEAEEYINTLAKRKFQDAWITQVVSS